MKPALDPTITDNYRSILYTLHVSAGMHLVICSLFLSSVEAQIWPPNLLAQNVI